MTEKVLCPWCGRKMKIYFEENGLKDYMAWSLCTYGKCAAEGPFIRGAKTEEEAIRLATEAALRRYEPPCRPMTKDEVKEHTVTRDASPLWMEWKVYEDMDEWVTSPAIKSLNIEENYGRVWRCWPRRPTDAEREAAGWEDDTDENKT